MLIFMVGLQHRIERHQIPHPAVDLAWPLYIVAALVLVFSPADRLGFVLIVCVYCRCGGSAGESA